MGSGCASQVDPTDEHILLAHAADRPKGDDVVLSHAADAFGISRCVGVSLVHRLRVNTRIEVRALREKLLEVRLYVHIYIGTYVHT